MRRKTPEYMKKMAMNPFINPLNGDSPFSLSCSSSSLSGIFIPFFV